MISRPTPKRDALAENFIGSMLKSAEENKETAPQTRFGDVNPQEIEKTLKEIQKGKLGR